MDAFAVAIRAVAALLMIGLPLAFALVWKRKYDDMLDSRFQNMWSVVGMGALCFATSQAIHIPLVFFILEPFMEQKFDIDLSDAARRTSLSVGIPLLVLSIFGGFLAAVCEEVSRWLFYRFWLKPKEHEKDYPTIILFGVGHGGCEAIMVGFAALSSLIVMSVFYDHAPQGQDPELFEQTLHEYWSQSGIKVMMAPFERLFAMTLQIALSLLVWRGYVDHNAWGLTAAIALHATVDAVAFFVVNALGVYATEFVLAVIFFPMALVVLVYYGKEHALDRTYAELLDAHDNEFYEDEEDQDSWTASSGSVPSLDDEDSFGQ